MWAFLASPRPASLEEPCGSVGPCLPGLCTWTAVLGGKSVGRGQPGREFFQPVVVYDT